MQWESADITHPRPAPRPDPVFFTPPDEFNCIGPRPPFPDAAPPRIAPCSSHSLFFNMADLLHDDIYEVVKVNPDGKKFERVNRLVCKGQTYETDLTLDIASEVYSLRDGEKFAFAIANTLRLDGKPDEDTYNQDGKVSGAALRCPGAETASAAPPPPPPAPPPSFPHPRQRPPTPTPAIAA